MYTAIQEMRDERGERLTLHSPNIVNLCIDSYDEEKQCGRLYHQYTDHTVCFSSLFEALERMERLYDEIQFPQAATRLRSFQETGEKTCCHSRNPSPVRDTHSYADCQRCKKPPDVQKGNTGWTSGLLCCLRSHAEYAGCTAHIAHLLFHLLSLLIFCQATTQFFDFRVLSGQLWVLFGQSFFQLINHVLDSILVQNT